MGRYDTAVRCTQIRNLVGENQYLKAMEEIEDMNFEDVPTISDLYLFADVFLRAEKMNAAKELYYIAYRRTASRPALYRLLMLAIRMGDIEEARELYLTYEIIAGVTLDTYELRYRLAKAAGEPRTKLIDILEQLKKDEYTEEWGFQLARLYEQEGMKEKCVKECEDLKRWFGSGKIVEKAEKLRKDCLSPTWRRPLNDEIPDLEKPDLEEPVAKKRPRFAFAPAQVQDIPVIQEDAGPKPEIPVKPEASAKQVREPEQRPVPPVKLEVHVKPEVLKEPELTLEPEIPVKPEVLKEPELTLEPEIPVKPEVLKEPELTLEPEIPVKPEVLKEPELTLEPEIPVKPEVLKKPEPSGEPEAEETQNAGEPEQTEPEQAGEKRETGFLKRLVNYFRVDLDMFEEELPSEETDVDEEETSAHEEKLSLHETGTAGQENGGAPGKYALDDALDAQVEAAAALSHPVESLEDQLQEMEQHAEEVLPLGKVSVKSLPPVEKPDAGEQKKQAYSGQETGEQPREVEEVSVKSHPLGFSALSEDIVEDVSRNGIRYNTLKGAIYKIHQETGMIHFALTGGTAGMSLAVAKKLFKELRKVDYFEAKNIGKIAADKLDSINLEEWAEKFIGGCMYIIDAPSLSNRSVKSLSTLIEKYGRQIVIILEGSYDEMDSFLNFHKEFEKQITYKVKL